MASDYIDLALVVVVVLLFSTVLLLKACLDLDKRARLFTFRLFHRRLDR